MQECNAFFLREEWLGQANRISGALDSRVNRISDALVNRNKFLPACGRKQLSDLLCHIDSVDQGSRPRAKGAHALGAQRLQLKAWTVRCAPAACMKSRTSTIRRAMHIGGLHLSRLVLQPGLRELVHLHCAHLAAPSPSNRYHSPQERQGQQLLCGPPWRVAQQHWQSI